jgi:plastocyanin
MAVASAVAMADPAGAKPATISVADFAFTPAKSTVKIGEAATWNFVPPIGFGHTTTDSTGLNLWDSGIKSAGSTFSHTFTGAGGFAYHCNVHPFMTGLIKVKPTAKPKSGTVTTSFKVTWATAAAPAGDVFDVQVSTPTSGGFVNFLVGTAAMSANYTPPNGTGTYEFQARMRSTSTGSKSAYSPPVTITVS